MKSLQKNYTFTFQKVSIKSLPTQVYSSHFLSIWVIQGTELSIIFTEKRKQFL
jgi:hypothetical protein